MEKKHYNTVGRAQLLACLTAHADTPRTAEEIYRALLASGKAPGRSSVYRMLSLLVDAGEVKKYRAERGYLYQYSGARNCEGHLHMQCLTCGGVIHLECACSDSLTEHLLDRHGFAVDRGKSLLYGTCAACLAKGVRA